MGTLAPISSLTCENEPPYHGSGPCENRSLIFTSCSGASRTLHPGNYLPLVVSVAPVIFLVFRLHQLYGARM